MYFFEMDLFKIDTFNLFNTSALNYVSPSYLRIVFLHRFMDAVLTISGYQITLPASVLVTPMSCQETSSLFSLAASMCC